MKTEDLYPRRCDITGEGMDNGWCWSDGVFYTKYKKDTIAELRNDLAEGHNESWLEESLDYPEFDKFNDLHHSKWTDDQLLEWAVESDLLYWTEWYEENIGDDGYGYDEKGNTWEWIDGKWQLS